jgi:hypothetical protein
MRSELSAASTSPTHTRFHEEAAASLPPERRS